MSARLLRSLFAVLAVAFFAAPVALRAAGVEAKPFENRSLAKPPSLEQGWEVFDQTTRFLIDRMPLREQAVRANTFISRRLFDTIPQYARRGGAADPDRALPFAGAQKDPGAARPARAKGALQGSMVQPGKHGWLYIAEEFSAACSPAASFERAFETWRALLGIVRKSGRRAVMLVAPDKGGIYPEHLDLDPAEEACVRRGKRRFWERLGGAGRRVGIVPLRDAVLRLKHRTHGLIYLRTDSHWNQLGATVLTKALVGLVGRGVRVAPGEIVKAASTRAPGDLTRLLGETGIETRPVWEVRRAPNAPRVPGKVLYLFDSYGDIVANQIDPYFTDLRRVVWTAGSPALVEAIAQADTVIFQTVERSFIERTTTIGEASPNFRRALQARLSSAGRPRR